MKKIFLLFAVLFSFKVFACSCGSLDYEALVDEADQIFIGTLNSAEIIANENSDPYVTGEIKVQESLKGSSKNLVSLKTGLGGGDCGMVMIIGEQYLIFLSGEKKVEICKGSSPIDIFTLSKTIPQLKSIIKKASNKSLNEDATNVAPIS